MSKAMLYVHRAVPQCNTVFSVIDGYRGYTPKPGLELSLKQFIKQSLSSALLLSSTGSR